MAPLTIRLLHTESCSPENAVAARQALDVALAEVGLSGHPVEDICIETEEQAVAYDFVGGPAVMVNGADVDPNVRGMRAGGLGCRAYITAEGISGCPPVAMIVAALREAYDA
jgi:hypothetical protein